MRLIKSVVLASVALATAVPTAARRERQAGPIQYGQYHRRARLQSDGTWYYTTFSGNIGGWKPSGLPDAQIIMWGSYNSGAER